MFRVFEGYHFLIFVVTALLIGLTLFFKRKLTDKQFQLYGKLIGLGLVAHQIYFHITHLLIQETYDIKIHLPLHLCGMSIYLVFIAILVDKTFLKNIALTYSPFGALLAIIFPEINNIPFFSFGSFEFFWSHIFILIGVLYLALEPNFKYSFKQALRFGLAFIPFALLVIYPINVWLGSNYMFLNRLTAEGPMASFPQPPMHLPVFAVVFVLVSIIQFLCYKKLNQFFKQTYTSLDRDKYKSSI